MGGFRQTIFSTPYFQFEKRIDFLFVYVMNTCDYFLCLPSWHHGKRRKLSWKVVEFYYQISVGTLIIYTWTIPEGNRIDYVLCSSGQAWQWVEKHFHVPTVGRRMNC